MDSNGGGDINYHSSEIKINGEVANIYHLNGLTKYEGLITGLVLINTLRNKNNNGEICSIAMIAVR